MSSYVGLFDMDLPTVVLSHVHLAVVGLMGLAALDLSEVDLAMVSLDAMDLTDVNHATLSLSHVSGHCGFSLHGSRYSVFLGHGFGWYEHH